MENVALIVFPAVMIFAAFSDILTMKIPNLASLLLLFSYLAISSATGTPWQIIGIHLACGFGVLAVGFVLFEAGLIGGGDAKLASASALWLGVENLADYVIVFSALGGVFAMAILAYRCRDFGESASSTSLLARIADKASSRIPYGVPLGVASLLLYPHSQIWRGLAGG